MEFIQYSYPNGILTIPEETIDGAFDYVRVDFEMASEDFHIKELEFWSCTHPKEMLRFWEELLNLKPEDVQEAFQQMLLAILLFGEAYTIHFCDFSFSYSPYDVPKKYESNRKSLTGEIVVSKCMQTVFSERDKVLMSCSHSFSYKEPETEKKVTVIMSKKYFGYKEPSVEQLRAFPDIKYEKYVQRLSNLWNGIRNNGCVGTTNKMKVLGVVAAYRVE